MEKEAGYVYILTNPSFKEDWVKIGKSSRPVDVRSKEPSTSPAMVRCSMTSGQGWKTDR